MVFVIFSKEIHIHFVALAGEAVLPVDRIPRASLGAVDGFGVFVGPTAKFAQTFLHSLRHLAVAVGPYIEQEAHAAHHAVGAHTLHGL